MLRLLRTQAPNSARRYLSNYPGSSFAPPPPSSLPKPRTSRALPPRIRKYARRLAYITTLTTTLYLADVYLNYSTLTRNAHTVVTCSAIALDYKLNFRASKSSRQLSRIHERNADRLLNLCLQNGGLYQKIGQAIAMQSAVLPLAFQERFSRFFDETPQAGWKEVERVLREEFPHLLVEGGGDVVDQLFMPGTWERQAIGSASIAQVHRARLKTGEQVAVKIQKPWIKRQVHLDLLVFSIVTYLFSTKLFALPLSFLTPFITERLLSETDFLNEANNAMQMRSFVESEPSLRNRVTIPKTYPELCTTRVLVAEYIDGVGIANRELLRSPWRDANSVGHPIGTPRYITARLGPQKPAYTAAGGPIYGLGLNESAVMETMIDLFCAQMFLFGWLHCDPHPGNILIRRRENGSPELILLDHGLYVTTTSEFRRDYATFWKALLTFDNTTIARIASSWGIGNADLMASATLLRPYSGGTQEMVEMLDSETAYDRHVRMREKMGEFLQDQEKMPKELIFIGRNMRIVQGNNQLLGSPVNRIKIIAKWASVSLARSGEDGGWVRAWWRHFVFRFVLLALDIGFWVGRVRQVALGGQGFEERLEERMKRVAREELGVELNHRVFDG